MPLTKRTPRPLSRDTADFRDDRLFIIGCDDTYAPQQYFSFFEIKRIRFHVVPASEGKSAANAIVDKLENIGDLEPDDEVWILLDVDHNLEPCHRPSFDKALKRVREKKIKIAISKPCFEIWLALHYTDGQDLQKIKTSAEVEKSLRNTLGEYNKTNLKAEHYSLEKVATACVSAKKLDMAAHSGDIPTANTSRIYLLWEAIIGKCTPAQLPHELRSLQSQLTQQNSKSI